MVVLYNQLNTVIESLFQELNLEAEDPLSLDYLRMLFELLYLHVRRSSNTSILYAWHFEIGVIAKRLSYHFAANESFQKAIDLNPSFELARLARDAGTTDDALPDDLVGTLSLFYSERAVDAIERLRATGKSDLASLFYREWCLHSLEKMDYFQCYKFANLLNDRGNLLESRMVFEHISRTHPDFKRSSFALGPEIELSEYLDKLSLLDAVKSRAGRDVSPVPLKTSDASRVPDLGPLIAKAPHLYRQLVNNQAYLLGAEERFARIASPSSPDYDHAVASVNDAIVNITCLKKKLTSLWERTVPKNGRSALLVYDQGVGDMIRMNGAVRFLSTRYDYVYIAVNRKVSESVREVI